MYVNLICTSFFPLVVTTIVNLTFCSDYVVTSQVDEGHLILHL